MLREPCPDCGFDAAAVDPRDLPALIRDTVPGFAAALARRRTPRVRPADNVWSPLEYACHVRDVHLLFDLRLRQMLGDDDPLFANWDQDATAVADDYAGQDPAVVAPALAAAAELVAATYDGISGDQWQRPGRRSDGSVFTAESLGRYHLHDVVHHLHDVGHDAAGDDGRGVLRRVAEAYADRHPRDAGHGAAGARPVRRDPRRRRAGARDRQRLRARRAALEERRPARSAAPTSRPGFVEAAARPRAMRPTCSTRSPTTCSTPPTAAVRRRCGPTPACSTSRARTCPCVLSPAGLGRPRRAGCSSCPSRRATAPGGRRTATSPGRATSRSGASSRCARSWPRPAGRCVTLVRGAGQRGETWLEVLGVSGRA